MQAVLDAMAKLDRLRPGRGDGLVPRGLAITRQPLIVVDPCLPTVQRPRKLSRWERVRVWFEGLVDGAGLVREVFPWRRVVRTEAVPAPFVYAFGDRILVHPAHAAIVRTAYS